MGQDRPTRSSANTLMVQGVAPGSQPLRNRVHERYARHRAQLLPPIESYRRAKAFAFRGGHYPTATAQSLCDAAYKIERKDDIARRISYLSNHYASDVTAKRQRIEAKLWAIHESNIKDLFEKHEIIKTKDGKIETTETGEIVKETRERPRLISDLPDEIAALIEDVTIDARGRAIPKLYNKLAASKELRAMLSIGKPSDASDVSRLSDAELVQQLAEQARELGVDIKLDYTFAQPSSARRTDGDDPQVIDNIEDNKREPDAG